MTSTLTNLLQSLRIAPMTHGKQPTHVATEKLPLEKSNSNAKSKEPTLQLRQLTLEQVANHDRYNDCWIVIYDRVYDVTSFLRDHPGGDDVIMDHAGRDATIAFHGTGHSRAAVQQMHDFLIGELPEDQRIFRTGQNQVLSLDIPE